MSTVLSGRKNQKRVLIKLSGEALGVSYVATDSGKVETVSRGLDYQKMDKVAAVLADLQQSGYEMGIVVGGGNICRGRDYDERTNRSEADLIGMMATAINAMALRDALKRAGAKARVLSAIPMEQICDTYTYRLAESSLENGEILVFACGSGRPYFSTDTASALRALEINAHTLYCAKSVDAVYDAVPEKNADAKPKRYDIMSYRTFLKKGLEALDQPAVALCSENKLPIFVFELADPENIKLAVKGEISGTWIVDEEKEG